MTVRFGLRAPRVGRTAQRAGPAVLRTAKAQPIRPRARPHAPLKRRRTRHIRAGRDNSSPPAVNATSSDELQPSACRGGELRGSASRKSTAHLLIISVGFGLSPIPPRRSAPGRTGRRFEEPRYSLSAQIPAQSLAQRGAKTVAGFRARRTVAAQSTAQFSAPCPPHCGSAVAPPHSRRPRQFLPDWLSANRQNMPFLRGLATEFCTPFFVRAPWEILSKHASEF